ncbi:Uncharacterised protein [Legionella busanensis]|uniref:Uncharacterized protein n=1 Tax=Legionella busanensis TaxID=190655 RepID=A0A378JWI2_9GAMM|nr:Uncharacterised protein [Legionella busanensis]
MKKIWLSIGFLTVYALICLIIFDWHYFFILCYRSGAGIFTKFHSFRLTSGCLPWAFLVIFFTWIILFLLTKFIVWIFKAFLKRPASLRLNIAIVFLITWLLHFIKPLQLVT